MRRLRLIAFALIVIAIIVAGGIALLARDRARSLIYPNRIAVSVSAADVGLPDAESVTFTTADGVTLEGWFAPPAPEADGALVIFVHGLSSNRTGLAGQAVMARARGYGVLLFDLRNHGNSGGTYTTLGYEEPRDVIAAAEYAASRPEVDPARLVLVGESLGGASVLRAMSELPDIAGVIAQSAYSSIEENIAEGVERITGLPPFPFAPLIIFFGQQETGSRISEVRPIDDVARLNNRPVLFMHGDADTLIDVANSQRMVEAAGEPKTLVIFPGATHGGLHLQAPVLFETALIEFLTRVIPVTEPTPQAG